MSCYITFIMGCELKKNIPQRVVDTLEYMTNPDKDANNKYPDHPVFETDDWEYMLGKSELTYNETSQTYHLKINNSIKDDIEQIEKFLHWIAPYSKSKGVVGFVQPDYYRIPARILFEKGLAYTIEPVENLTELENYSKPPTGKRVAQMVEGLRELAFENPNLAPMLQQQIKAVEALGGNNAGKALRGNPLFESVAEMMKYFVERPNPDLP